MKKRDVQLRDYYAEIRKQIPDVRMQKKITDDLRADVGTFLAENPDADFRDIERRFGTPEEISDYYIASKEPHELKKQKRSPVFFVVLAVIIFVVCTAAIAVMLQLDGGGTQLPVSSGVSSKVIRETAEPSRVKNSVSSESGSEAPFTDPFPIVETESSFYLLPQSSYRKLAEEDVEELSHRELMLARNEIYARHGRRFIAEDVQNYFDAQDWYRGTMQPEDFEDEKMLNAVEQRNIQFLLRLEKESLR